MIVKILGPILKWLKLDDSSWNYGWMMPWIWDRVKCINLNEICSIQNSILNGMKIPRAKPWGRSSRRNWRSPLHLYLTFFFPYFLFVSLCLSFILFPLYTSFYSSTCVPPSLSSGPGEKPRGVCNWESGGGHSPFPKMTLYFI